MSPRPLRLAEIAKLMQFSRDAFRQNVQRGDIWTPSLDETDAQENRDDEETRGWARFRYSDALAIEVARQLSDGGDEGIMFRPAMQIVGNCGSCLDYMTASDVERADYWVALVMYRNTYEKKEFGANIAHTKFGPDEYWSKWHVRGTFSEVTSTIATQTARDREAYPDSDPAKILMSSVTAADRRLRARAKQLGFDVVGNEFSVNPSKAT